jgi:glycosyltransferase involved in cell wall biosynthesis
MNNLKVALICTVKNEAETIVALLDSILNQTKKPEEVIIVDGGSTDSTLKILESYTKRLPLVVISSPNSNIAKGRNKAIINSKCDLIASTDGGCKLAGDWLEKITTPFESGADVVCGVYAPWIESEFEEIASYLIFPIIDRINQNTFMPSSRSVAFRKNAWVEVDGYPEWLQTAEDTLFDLKLAKAGKNFSLARDATVYWRVRESSKRIFKQHFNYAKGDGEELLYNQRYLPRYFVSALFLLLTGLFWANPIFWFSVFSIILAGLWTKHLRKVKTPSLRRIYAALLVVSAIEIGLFLGYLKGLGIRINGSHSVLKKNRSNISFSKIQAKNL